MDRAIHQPGFGVLGEPELESPAGVGRGDVGFRVRGGDKGLLNRQGKGGKHLAATIEAEPLPLALQGTGRGQGDRMARRIGPAIPPAESIQGPDLAHRKQPGEVFVAEAKHAEVHVAELARKELAAFAVVGNQRAGRPQFQRRRRGSPIGRTAPDVQDKPAAPVGTPLPAGLEVDPAAGDLFDLCHLKSEEINSSRRVGRMPGRLRLHDIYVWAQPPERGRNDGKRRILARKRARSE